MLATTLVFDTILRLIFKNLENHSTLIFGLRIDDGPTFEKLFICCFYKKYF